ncbi:U-box domain-containing protein 21 [Acorus gramineus]|uniref:U-box domain-containing protein n=1 Tax=Acorus gramineus TaxID=55184 RepID=A0AAV9AHJ4_ACOGR|nr:U-box domain-containing protein 21 [Acorus gramineus]
MWRTRKQGLRNPFSDAAPRPTSNIDVSVPTHFRCPISLDLMKDPVTLSTGITYDRQSIETWLDSGSTPTCPVTNLPLDNLDLIPNHAIRHMIQDWCVKNRSLGIERVPTPRVPVTGTDASDLLARASEAAARGDRAGCRDLAEKVRALAKESERNRRCFVGRGAGPSLARAFAACADEAVLSALVLMLPLDESARTEIKNPSSMKRLAWMARHGDISGRLNAVRVIKDVVSSDKASAESAAGIEELAEALVEIIREPISPQTTKASLITVFFLAASNEAAALKFVRLGVVGAVLEALGEAERGVSEKSLAVLDGLAETEEGRRAFYEHELAVPALVKKMLRVSDAATEYAVSTLWKLCKGKREEEKYMVGALQVGAFQKLLLLLQVGCGETTKERASELLKMLNVYRWREECIDSMDFKYLKRPF